MAGSPPGPARRRWSATRSSRERWRARWPASCGGGPGGPPPKPDPSRALHTSQGGVMDSRTTWPALIGALVKGETLTSDEAAWAMNEIMEGAATPAQIAGFGVALRMKGETVGELAGLADVMLSRATPLAVPGPVVEALGVVINLAPEATTRLVQEVGIAFLFAPLYHPALRHTAVPRRELGVPTVFNFIGPVANPARPSAQAVGVSDPRMGAIIAGVLAARGCSALVFHGDDGLDELTTADTSTVWVVHDGTVSQTVLDPADLGLPRSRRGDLRGGDAATNAAVARAVLAGEPGPVRDTVVLNAGAALAAAAGVPRAEGLAGVLVGACARAAAALDSGASQDLLNRWVAASQRLAAENS